MCTHTDVYLFDLNGLAVGLTSLLNDKEHDYYGII